MFKDNVKIVQCVTVAAAASGSTDVTSSAVDTLGFSGCCFVIPMGPITTGAAAGVKVQQSSDSGGSPDGYSDLTGTAQTIADDYDNKVKYVDIVRPQKRYLKIILTRATQASTAGGVIAYLYNPRKLPVTQDSGTVSGESFLNVAEGTA